MTITTPNGNSAQAQLRLNYAHQINDYETRRALTGRYSEAISVANPQRNEFMEELKQLLSKYENQY